MGILTKLSNGFSSSNQAAPIKGGTFTKGAHPVEDQTEESKGFLANGIQAEGAPVGVVEQKEDLIQKVYVKHYRFMDFRDDDGSWEEYTEELRHEEEIRELIYQKRMAYGDSDIAFFPRGGTTEVTLILSDGREVTGRADCSLQDNYNKKLGKHIAYQRALKKL